MRGSLAPPHNTTREAYCADPPPSVPRPAPTIEEA